MTSASNISSRPVNTRPILATGGEGGAYTLVDDLRRTSLRLRRSGTFTYTVDVLYNDGTPTTTIGPFEVTGSSDRTPTRRQR